MRCENCNIALTKTYQIGKLKVCRHCKKDHKQHGKFTRQPVNIDLKSATQYVNSITRGRQWWTPKKK